MGADLPGAPNYTPSRALAELKAQHDALRWIMTRCEELADELDAGRGGHAQLADEVAQLRHAFESHNAFEERLLRPVLLGTDAFAEVRIDRMVEDHVGEHRAMRARLDTTETSALRDTLEMLRAHLDSEERYVLSTRVLHYDIITVEDGA